MASPLETSARTMLLCCCISIGTFGVLVRVACADGSHESCQHVGSVPVQGTGIITTQYPVTVGLLVDSVTDIESNQTMEALQLAEEEINENQSLKYERGGGVNWVMRSAVQATHWQRFGALEASLSLIHTDQAMVIVGMSSVPTATLVGPIAGDVGIPAVVTGVTDRETHQTAYQPTLMRACPSDIKQAVALKDVLLHYAWHRVGLVFSSKVTGFHTVNNIVEITPTFGITVAQGAQVEFDGNHVNGMSSQRENLSARTRQQMANFTSKGIRVVILKVHSSELLSVLRHAKQLGMLSKGYAWIVLHFFPSLQQLPKEAVDLLNGALVLRAKVDSTKAAGLAKALNKRRRSLCPDGKAGCLSLQTVYTYDAAIALGHAFSKWINTTGVPSADPCAVTIPGIQQGLSLPKWHNISRLVDNLRSGAPLPGVGGQFSLGDDYAPADYTISNIVDGKLVSIGEWTTVHTLDLSAVDSGTQTVLWTGGTTEVPSTRGFLNQHLNVYAAVSEPFVYPPRNHPPYSNSDFSGVAIDALKEVARRTGFNYTIHLWNNSRPIDELVRTVGDPSTPYDLVVSSLSVTKDRSKYCTFTKSFFLSSLRILTKPPKDEDFAPLRVLQPFDWSVWLVTIMTLTAAGAVLTYLNPDGVESERGKDIFVDGIFFSFMSFFQAHDGANMKRSLSRTFLLVIQFSNLILTAMYTAHLTAFLSGQLPEEITGFNDLYHKPVACRYGTEDWDYVNSKLGLQKVIAVSGQSEALAALRSGSVVAYIAQKPHLALLASENTDLRVVGREVDTQQFAFALTRESPWKPEIDRALGLLVTQGNISGWYNDYAPGRNDQSEGTDEDRPITAGDVWTMFLVPLVVAVLLVGLPIRRYFCLRPRKELDLANSRETRQAMSRRSAEVSFSTTQTLPPVPCPAVANSPRTDSATVSADTDSSIILNVNATELDTTGEDSVTTEPAATDDKEC